MKKERIQHAQLRAVLAVNRELVLLYRQIGREIVTRQHQQGWGAKVIDRLARDLRSAFPEMKGFSPRNLKYMRTFAAAYPDEPFMQQIWGQRPTSTRIPVSLPHHATGAHGCHIRTITQYAYADTRAPKTVCSRSAFDGRVKTDRG
jgi:hypothetical protein